MKKIFLLILSLVFTSSLFASDYYWVGSSGANWGAASNFKIGGFAGTTATVLPTVADNLFIGNGSANAIITLNISDTINDITFLGSGQIFINTSNGSALRVEGNLTASNTNTTGGGSAVILFGGSSNQSLTGSTTGINKNKLPNLTIDKSGGTLTFYNTITMGGSTKLRYVSGTLDAGTSVFVFYFANVTQGKISLYDAVFEGNNTSYKMIDTLTVTDTLKTTGSSKCELDSGVIILTGNLRIENTSGNARGGAKILLRGTANQTLSSAASVSANQGEIAGIYIQKTSGTVHIKGKITLYQWENNYSTANVYADSSTVVFDGGNSNALGGTYSTHFWDVDFSNKIGQTTIVLGTGSVSKVMHNLIISGTANFTINSNTIEVEGNLTLTNTSNSTGGSGTIKICGSANQTLTGTSSTTDCELPSLTIDKSGGTATMSAFFNVRGNFTYVAGTVDATTHSSTVFKYTGTLDGQGTSSTMNFNNVNIERQVTLGGTLNVNGALTLTNGSSFNSSNDSINLQGDLTVNDAFAFSSSVITFKGNQSQAVNGTAAQTFYKVIVNKSGNHITLSKNLTITNNLTLTAGNIISGASALVILNDNATVSSASDNSFVSGPVKKTGNDAFTFPTGKSGHYHAIGITAPSSTTDAFTAEYFSSAYSDLTKDTSLTYINNCEYWNLDRTTGSSNVKVTLYWTNNICDIYTLSTLRVSRYDGGTSKWKSVTTATTSGNTTTGSIQTDNNQSTFGYFAIGKRSPAVYAHAGTDASICAGSSTTIGDSPAATGGLTPYNYSWSPSTGLSNSTIANPSASPSTTTNYILTVTDLDHTTAKDTMILTIHNNPVADAGRDTTVCNGTTMTIGGSPTSSGGSSPYTYAWTPSTELSATNVANPNTSATSDLYYTLLITDNYSCISRDTIYIHTGYLPVADAGSDYTVCEGIGVILGGAPVASDGIPPYTFEWKDSSGVFISDFETPGVFASSHYYILLVTDSNLCISRDTVVINTTPAPHAHAGSDTAVCYGSTLVLGDSPAATGGDSEYIYQWFPDYYLNSKDVANPFARCIFPTYYILHVIDSSSCPAIDDTVFVDIKPKPDIYAGDERHICQGGDTAMLGADGYISDGEAPLTYYWTPDYYINDTSLAHPTVNPPSDTFYVLTVTDGFGCIYYAEESVTISKNLAFAGFDQTVMQGSEIFIGGGSYSADGQLPYSFLWVSSNVEDSTEEYAAVKPDSSQHYIIKVTDNKGCFATDTTEITVTAHADSINHALQLHTPDDTTRFYKLITMDSVIWFKFDADSTNAVIACGWYDGFADYSFTQISLFSDTNFVTPLFDNSLTEMNSRNLKHILAEDLVIGNYYYLRIRKYGDTTEGIIIYYNGLSFN